MRRSRRLSFPALVPWAAVLLLTASCATSYGPKGILGAGFSEERLAPDLWMVTFDASAFTPQERLKSYLLLRCAEVTVEQGASYFIVMSEGQGRVGPTRPSLIDQPPFPLERETPEPNPPPARQARAAIRLYKEKPEEKSYDARALVRQLSSEQKS
jgi:hypothetical protein